MPPEPPKVCVKLVGAGPGAADLLTLRAARAIGEAQALLYDALVSDEVLAFAPVACLRVQTGKRAGRPSMDQRTINRLMLRLARKGLRVVRLKGGDPSVFGRVGEEQAFLRGHGVATETIPGITAAGAAAAQFQFPLTHRGEARRVVFSTATLAAGAVQDAWAEGAAADTTLAVYMGRDQIAQVCEGLMALGRSPRTPALAVENAGRPEARLIGADLETLGAAMAGENLDGPVVVVIGDVAGQAAASDAGLASVTRLAS